MNKILIIGNLTGEPELRATPSGITVCSFTIAVNRRHEDKTGERQADYFRISAWRQLGESCGRFLTKGRKVAVVGELQARLYDAKDGSARMSLDVQADKVEFLSPRTQDDAARGENDDTQGMESASGEDVSQ
ncbi:MAG: single-stranded DNA-binding protein [Christensenella sp.]|nr:single-stranded DNA-binding protein [Christensenella sp.]